MNFYTSMLLSVLCMISFDITHAFICYQCTSPNCGKTIGDGSAITTVECPADASCSTSTTSIDLGGDNVIDSYTRSCQTNCIESCFYVEGMPICTRCCKGNRCNADYVEQALPPTPVAGLMCYNCTSENPACGKTISDPSTLQQIPCSGQCMTMKTTSTFQGNEVGIYERSCSDICLEFCQEFPPEAGSQGMVCSTCCNDAILCNARNAPGTVPPVLDMTPESSAISISVNVVNILFTGILSINLY